MLVDSGLYYATFRKAKKDVTPKNSKLMFERQSAVSAAFLIDTSMYPLL